jgi:hypothetical protein
VKVSGREPGGGIIAIGDPAATGGTAVRPNHAELGGKEVDKQLVDAVSLVVMHPVHKVCPGEDEPC